MKAIKPIEVKSNSLANFVQSTKTWYALVKALPKLAKLVARNETSRYYDARTHGYGRDYDLEFFIQDAMCYPSIYRNMNLIARTIACATGKVQIMNPDSPNGWADDLGHPFNAIIEGQMNPFMGQQFGWELSTHNLLAYGKMAFMLVPNRLNGELLQMWPLPANRVIPVPDRKKGFAGFWYLPVDEVVKPQDFVKSKYISYSRFPNLFDYHGGWPLLKTYQMALGIGSEMDKVNIRDIIDGLKLQSIIGVSPSMSDPDFDVVKDDILSQWESRIQVIRSGEMDLKTVTRPLDGKFTETMKNISNEDIDSTFGVPSSLWSPQPTKANNAGAIQVFLNNTAWPIAKLIAEDITVQVVKRWYGQEYRFVFEDFRPKNREQDLKEDEFSTGFLTLNEIRAKKGEEPYPDDDIGLAPANAAREAYLLKLGHKLALESGKVNDSPESIQAPVNNRDDERIKEITEEIEDAQDMEESDGKSNLFDQGLMDRLIQESQKPESIPVIAINGSMNNGKA